MSKNNHKCKGACVEYQGTVHDSLPGINEWESAYMTLVNHLRREHKRYDKGYKPEHYYRADTYARAYAYAQGVASNHGVELPDLDETL